ncbi:MAG: ABATE domain-containing protein [Gemmatimonadota bacterium]
MPETIGGLQLVAGEPALDFTNTVSWRGAEQWEDWLEDFGDLLWWGVRAGLLDPGAVRARLKRVTGVEEEIFRRAIALREAIHDVFGSLARRSPPSDAALTRLSEEWTRAQSRRRLVVGEEGFGSRIVAEEASELLISSLAANAGDLLLSMEPARVKLCAGHECGFLYADTSRNRSRRWCDMADCGNRAKVRRFRARSRADSG